MGKIELKGTIPYATEIYVLWSIYDSEFRSEKENRMFYRPGFMSQAFEMKPS